MSTIDDTKTIKQLLDEINDRYSDITNSLGDISELNALNLQVVDKTNIATRDLTTNFTKIKNDFNSLTKSGQKFAKSFGVINTFKQLQKQLSQDVVQAKLFGNVLQHSSATMVALGKNASVMGTSGFASARDNVQSLNQELQIAAAKMQHLVTIAQFDAFKATADSAQGDIALFTADIASANAEIRRLNSLGVAANNSAYLNQLDVLEAATDSLAEQKMLLTDINSRMQQAVIVTDDQRNNYRKILSDQERSRDSLQKTVVAQQTINQRMIPWMERIDKIGARLDKIKDGLHGILGDIPLLGDAINSISFAGIADKMKTIVSQTVMGMSSRGFFGKIWVGFKSVFKLIGALMIGLAGLFIGVFLAGIGIAMQRFQQMQRFWLQARRSAGSITGQNANFSGIVGALGGMFGQGDVKAASLYKTMRKLKDVTVATAKQVQVLDRRFAVSAQTSSEFLQTLRYSYGATQKMSGDMGVMVSNMAVMQGIQPQRIIEAMADASADVLAMFGKSKRVLATNALFAAKMNTSLQQMAKTARGFLDIENMIESSMEIQLMTGKQLDVGRLVALTAANKGGQAFALAVSSLGKDLVNASPFLDQTLTKALSMDATERNKIYKYMKDNNTTAIQAYNAIQSQVNKNMTQDAVKGFLQLKTHAAGYLTSMQAFKKKMVTLIYKAFGPVVDWLMANLFSTKTTTKLTPLFNMFHKISSVLVKILDFIFGGKGFSAMGGLFKSIGSVIGEAAQKFAAFVSNKQNMDKLGQFIKEVWQYAKKLGPILSDVFKHVWKGIKWVIDFIKEHPKGALWAVLGIGSALIIIPKLVKYISLLLILNKVAKAFGYAGVSMKGFALALKSIIPIGIAVASVAIDAAGAFRKIDPNKYKDSQTGMIDYTAVKAAEHDKKIDTGQMLGGAAGGLIGLMFGGPMGALLGQQIGKYIGGFIAENSAAIGAFFNNLKQSFQKVIDSIANGILGVWKTMTDFLIVSIPKFFTQTLPNAFKTVINTITLFINRMVFGIFQKLPDWMVSDNMMKTMAKSMLDLGQSRNNIAAKYLPKKASGAAILGTSTGQAVTVGERNQDEAIVPLPMGIKTFLTELDNYRSNQNSKADGVKVAVTTPVHVYIDGKQIAKYVKQQFIAGSPRYLTVG